MKNSFNVICMDPPWNFADKLQMSDVARGAIANYNTLSIPDIKKLSIKNLASPDGAILALWTPSSLLQEGLDVMKEYGFHHKQTYVWVKTKKQPLDTLATWVKKILLKSQAPLDIKGATSSLIKEIGSFNVNSILSMNMGRLFRQTHEICLLGTNNTKIYKLLSNKSQRSVSFAENLKHSAKPETLQNSLELMFPNCRKIEIFSRRQRPGWICLGNESPMSRGEDISVSLSKVQSLTEPQYQNLLGLDNYNSLFDAWQSINNVNVT